MIVAYSDGAQLAMSEHAQFVARSVRLPLRMIHEHRLPPAMSSAEEIEAHTRKAVQESAPWVEALGRVGHAAHGGVYATVGLLAAQAALGIGGAATDPEGVLVWILEASFGQLLLGVMAAGLIGYAVWRFVQAIRDTEAKGTKPGGLLARAGFAGSGIVYLSLALSALQLTLGVRGAAEHDVAQEWTARLLNASFGQALVLVGGLVVLGVAAGQAYCAYRAEFRRNLTGNDMPPSLQSFLVGLGRFGYAARAVVFLIVGVFLILAGLAGDPGQARGFGGALTILADQPFGPWLLLDRGGWSDGLRGLRAGAGALSAYGDSLDDESPDPESRFMAHIRVDHGRTFS